MRSTQPTSDGGARAVLKVVRASSPAARNGRGSPQKVTRHFLIMRAVPRQAAFEQDEAIHRERLAKRGFGGARRRRAPRPRVAAEASERHVGVKGAALGSRPARLAGALDLRRERRDRALGLDAGP